jgi:hypothetical protein
MTIVFSFSADQLMGVDAFARHVNTKSHREKEAAQNRRMSREQNDTPMTEHIEIGM